jgi:hypothetical protein
MARLEAPDALIERSVSLGVEADGQVIGDSVFGEAQIDLRMGKNAGEGVADEQGVTGFGIEKRDDSKVIAGREKAIDAGIPEGEGKIAGHLGETLFTPQAIGVEEEFDVGGLRVRVITGRAQTPDETIAVIETNVAGEMNYIEGDGAWKGFDFVSGLKQTAAEPDGALMPGGPAIGPTSGQLAGEAFEKRWIDRQTGAVK